MNPAGVRSRGMVMRVDRDGPDDRGRAQPTGRDEPPARDGSVGRRVFRDPYGIGYALVGTLLVLAWLILCLVLRHL